MSLGWQSVECFFSHLIRTRLKDNIQSSGRNGVAIENFTYVLIPKNSVVIAARTLIPTTFHIQPASLGFSKFGVTPGGGGNAPARAVALLIVSSIAQREQ